MHLRRYSDYSLRLLVYLGLHPERPVTIAEIARAYDICKKYLMKVGKDLVAEGFVHSVKGKSGGLLLANPPSAINIGTVVRRMEADFELVECLGESNTCSILPACKLKSLLYDAGQRFLKILDAFTLADILINRAVLLNLVSDDRQREIRRTPK